MVQEWSPRRDKGQEGKGRDYRIKRLTTFFKSRKCSLMNRQQTDPFKDLTSILMRCQNHFVGNLLYFDVAGKQ